MQSPDIVIAGAGLIGLSCALECDRLGLTALVLEREFAGRQASWAAAGMLAAHDAANPTQLQSLAQLSIDLYPEFLSHIQDLGGAEVPIETEWTLERAPGFNADLMPSGFRREGFQRIAEKSLDPRKLIAAMLRAVHAAAFITLKENVSVNSARPAAGGLSVSTSAEEISCGMFLDCTGAWSSVPVRPAKGQMLRVHAPDVLHTDELGNVVVRTPEIYMVPRLDGSVVIGATLEDAGFDRTVHEADLRLLHEKAISIMPAFEKSPLLESWSGLRPDTVDHLPILGQTGEHTFVATGHFRNGVLLAAATGHVMGQMLMGKAVDLDLGSFSPGRFTLRSR